MQTILKIGTIVLAISLLVSCSSLENESIETLPDLTVNKTFSARWEGLSTGTKTSVSDDGSVWWRPAEEISVFFESNTSGGVKFISNNDTPSESVDFVGSISNSGNDYWAVYPYSVFNAFDGSAVTIENPSVQEAIVDDFPGTCFPTIARTSTRELMFMNVCGGIKFQVNRNDIKTITIKGNNGEALAGIVKVVIGADNNPVISEYLFPEMEVTLIAPDCGTFESGKYYYCSLFPSTLSAGYTITMQTASLEGKYISQTSQTVKRSIIGIIRNADSRIGEWTSSIGYESSSPKIVDMGLSVKWASFNVGATQLEQMGDEFAWGEVSTKNKYDWSTYKWSNGNTNKITKYNFISENGYNKYVDNDSYLDREDDVAYAYYNDMWRMPSKKELNELLTCHWEWSTLHGVPGYKVTSNKTNNWLFFPVNGDLADYWSDELDTSSKSFILQLTNTGKKITSDYRYTPKYVRPVYSDKMPEEILLSFGWNVTSDEIDLYEKYTIRFVCNFNPSTAKCPVSWSSDNESVASVDQDGLVTGISPGVATITATTIDNAFSKKCKITVLPFEDSFVDLGVTTVKWSKFNLGSSSISALGSYYAWGEEAPKDSYDAKDSYPRSWSKDKDPARIAFGKNCRVPTRQEIQQLLTNTDQVWSTESGRQGVKIYKKGSRSGDYLFLPAGGYMEGTTKKDNNRCWYWTTTSTRLSTDFFDTKTAWALKAYENKISEISIETTSAMRSHGLLIRFVYDPTIQ